MNYNVKTIEYVDSVQVRTYKRPVTVSNKINLPQPKQKHIPEPKERTQYQIEHSIKSSVNRTINQIYTISRANKWEYFITLTIDPKKLDNTDFNLVSEKLNIWTNNLKKRYAPDLKYIIVPELHKDKSKWHFHGLFANIGKMPLTFSGKVCVGKFVYDYVKKPFATKIYNIPLWKYGFSTATIIRDSSKASSYITKYITKDLSHILQNQHRYLASQNIDKPLERVFNIDYDELTRIYSKYLSHITYMSDVKLPGAGQEILYMELQKGKGNPAPCKTNFSIFEPELKKPVCMDNDTQMSLAKQLYQNSPQKEIKLSPAPASAKKYLQQLRELKAFLKEHPEVKSVYRDINIDFLILQTKRKIMYEEENEIEQDRQISNDFIPAVGVPFL
ncbi:MAG: hypothetical protein ACLR4F_04265 [Ruminococcus sp.]